MRWLYLLLISSFGPYIFLSIGIRLEHFVIYSALVFIVATNSMRIMNSELILLPILFLSILFTAPFVGLLLVDYSINTGLIISQIENYLQPIAIIFICFSISNRLSSNELEIAFSRLLKVLVIMMALHTLISFAMYLYPMLEFWRYFTGADLIYTEDPLIKGYTAAEVARTAGRVSGVFTQIFEAGYAYAIGLISWAYLYSKYRNFMSFKFTALLLIIFGGLLVSSKVFIVFGLGLSFYCFNRKLLIFFWIMLGFFLIALSQLIHVDLSFFAKSFKYASRLTNVSPETIFSVFTGNRFSFESSVIINMNEILITNPFFGRGYGSLQNSDFSLYEVLFIGGLVGLSAYVLLFLMFIRLSFFFNNNLDRNYYVSIIVLTIFTSLAAPTITANRVSIFFWIIWAFSTAIVFSKSRSKNNA